MKSSLEMSSSFQVSRKRSDVLSAISLGLMPLASAARWILSPCSSVPVRKKVSSPSKRCQRARASAMTVV
jgi:hypothetical protein